MHPAARIKAILIGIGRGWPSILLPLAFTFSVMFLGFWPYRSERSIQNAGLALQVSGLILTLFGYRQTGKLFGLPGLLKAFYERLRRIPIYGRTETITVTGVASSSATGKLRTLKWINCPTASFSNPDIRIELLRQNLESLKCHVIRIEKDQTDHVLKFLAHVENVNRRLELLAQEDKKISDKLFHAQTGGLPANGLSL